MNKEESRKVTVTKDALDVYCDLTLFAFRCPAFTFSITWKDYLSQFRSASKDILLHDPVIVREALLDFAEHGSLEKLFALPLVYFRAPCRTYLDGFISVEPSVTYYVTMVIKAYSKFYNSFNKSNYLMV